MDEMCCALCPVVSHSSVYASLLPSLFSLPPWLESPLPTMSTPLLEIPSLVSFVVVARGYTYQSSTPSPAGSCCTRATEVESIDHIAMEREGADGERIMDFDDREAAASLTSRKNSGSRGWEATRLLPNLSSRRSESTSPTYGRI